MKLRPLFLRRILASGAITAVVLGAVGGGLAPSANAVSDLRCDTDSCSVTFAYTGALETFTVPADAHELRFTVSGAQGGSSVMGNAGGKGGTARGVLSLAPGDQLTVLVGEAGARSGGETFGGGGSSNGEYLGSGGGGSFIFDSAGHPLVAAGGGGGASLDDPSGGAGAGALGTGGSGFGIGYQNELLPTGGTQASGGAHGSVSGIDGNDGSGPADAGQPGRGGNGVGLPGDSGYYVGGGGGGGYYGGGGGAYAQAGAGGSGYAAWPSISTLYAGGNSDHTGNGVISFSWDVLPQTVTFTSPVPSSAVAGSTLNVTTSGGASGNPVRLSVDSSSTDSACSITGSTVHFDHAGTCVIAAAQAATEQYGQAPTALESIDVTTIPATVSVTSTPTVYGQAIQVTASVDNGGGTPDGTVQFAVDGDDVGSPVTVVGGTAQSAALTAPDGSSPARGGHPVTATYQPNDPTVYGGATGSTIQVVDPAATTTAVRVSATRIRAAVSPVAPGAGTVAGAVTFSVGGHSVGTANVVNGQAVLAYAVPNGKTQTVAAVYSGGDSFTASSDSTSRSDPSITATVTSARPKSRAGWYRTAVKVTFLCTAHGAPLSASCPAAVQFTANRAAQSVSRTVTAIDGGAATVAVTGISLDRALPSVTVSGIKNGAVYGGSAPSARCVARDTHSGVASCRIARRTSGSVTQYTATATDKAGNTVSIRGSYRVLSIYVAGASYSDGAFSLRAGRTSTLVVTGKARRPAYYAPVHYPHKPTQRLRSFNAAGQNRWTLNVTPSRSMRSQPYWNLGVKIGDTMHVMKVRVIG